MNTSASVGIYLAVIDAWQFYRHHVATNHQGDIMAIIQEHIGSNQIIMLLRKGIDMEHVTEYRKALREHARRLKYMLNKGLVSSKKDRDYVFYRHQFMPSKMFYR